MAHRPRATTRRTIVPARRRSKAKSSARRRAGLRGRRRLRRLLPGHALHGPRSYLVPRRGACCGGLKGGQTPPLSDDQPRFDAAQPGRRAWAAGHQRLFGDQELNQGLHGGARITFGTWLGGCQENGVEFSLYDPGREHAIVQRREHGQSDPCPAVLQYDHRRRGFARHRLSERGQRHVQRHLHGESSMAPRSCFGGHSCMAATGGSTCCWAIASHNLTDGLQIDDAATSSGNGGIAPAGTTIEHRRYLPHAKQLQRRRPGLFHRMAPRTLDAGNAFEDGHRRHAIASAIDGATSVTANGTTTVANGGLLALPSNIGTHDSNQFSVMPEIGLHPGVRRYAALAARESATRCSIGAMWRGRRPDRPERRHEPIPAAHRRGRETGVRPAHLGLLGSGRQPGVGLPVLAELGPGFSRKNRLKPELHCTLAHRDREHLLGEYGVGDGVFAGLIDHGPGGVAGQVDARTAHDVLATWPTGSPR